MPENPSALDTNSRETPVLALLDSLSKLKNGWNSYSAPPPTTLAIENAKLLVSEACSCNTIPERVEPSAMGGVGVTFSGGSREIVIEFYNNGTAHALFADNLTKEMDTRPVLPNVNSYRVILEEIRNYFHVLPSSRSNVS
jgi:hypothetical protein